MGKEGWGRAWRGSRIEAGEAGGRGDRAGAGWRGRAHRVFHMLLGLPAENRWTAYHPFMSWLVMSIGLYELGSAAFMLAFDTEPEVAEDATEQEWIRHKTRVSKTESWPGLDSALLD